MTEEKVTQMEVGVRLDVAYDQALTAAAQCPQEYLLVADHAALGEALSTLKRLSEMLMGIS
jgi:hypothetical protein